MCGKPHNWPFNVGFAEFLVDHNEKIDIRFSGRHHPKASFRRLATGWP
jgi:hypothetical protein